MKFFAFTPLVFAVIAMPLAAQEKEKAITFKDNEPRAYFLEARASEIDSRVMSYPEINFVIEGKTGKPADLQFAAVDTRVEPRGEIVIWLMGNKPELFNLLNSYGIHVIAPNYARSWFSILCQDKKPIGPQDRGNVRLEAATGKDFSEELDLAEPDGAAERSRQFLMWLAKNHPQGEWSHFLTNEEQIRWDRVILAGSSHGATTAARFAKHQKVARVVCHCGPRDQYQEWQALPSATPANRFFGFSHVLDGGWRADHYCRSWELLGLHQYGEIVNIDQASPPYQNTRRLISAADVGGDAKKAHSVVTPSKGALVDKDGELLYRDVWRYLYTHPTDQVGIAMEEDTDCLRDHRQ